MYTTICSRTCTWFAFIIDTMTNHHLLNYTCTCTCAGTSTCTCTCAGTSTCFAYIVET